ncbi:MAG: cytochrome c [Bacteroidia bacterium]|nr:cytochrome c [Bacteroidia bacterium]NND10956.1 cytochrome c [Flavobacteriaceae bacterium]NNK27397.1 cytochrome c [Flavobacteriaceae bacterium]
MRSTLKLLALILVMGFMACGGEEKKEETSKIKLQRQKTEKKVEKKAEGIPASKRIALNDKGVGPIKTLTLDESINQDMVTHGADVFKKMCTACHKVGKKFIGPAPNNILERRSPEWVMNMILDPEKMVKEDKLARDLLIEFNGSPMANQNLSEEDARAVLEFFRTLK